MFRRGDLIVTQWEHSRLSGTLASLLGAAVGLNRPHLFAAIALHDWPHFPGTGVVDVIEIGKKSAAQQQELVGRLSRPLPLDPFTELIVRLHWRRLSEDDEQLRTACDEPRIESLRKQLGIGPDEMARCDRWTDLCDMFAFYLSRGESAEGEDELADPWSQTASSFTWKTEPSGLEVRGLPSPAHQEVSLLAFHAQDYPDILQPEFVHLSCSLQPSSH